MGGLPWDVAARDLPVPEAISQRRAALGIPQATPRAQEAPPQAAKRGQGQACGDGQTAPDTQDQSTKTSKSVYNIISTQGCLNRPYGTVTYLTHRQVVRNPHVERPGFLMSTSRHPRTAVRRGRHDPDIPSLRCRIEQKDDPSQFLGSESQPSAPGLLLPPPPMGR